MSDWSTADIPPQKGKVAIVTGGNSGTGYETALGLSRAGATVVLAARSVERGLSAVGRVLAAVPGANISFEALDLASLASVAAFAARIAQAHERVDILINNAGVMMPPQRRTTADGFEMQFGTNYLGHFALTAHLLPVLSAAKARVVQLSSVAHKRGAINFADPQSTRSYRPYAVYAQSKLAMLMFALELQRQSDAHGWALLSLAAHPGVATTALVDNGMGNGLPGKLTKVLTRLIGQTAAAGALPVLFAATAPGVVAGGYYGSVGFQEMRGPVGTAKIMPQALDQAAARRLWDLSLDLTGVTFSAAVPAPNVA
jgi:NAD(P)-dependent dehydrogenase (short-subunit alcohol dehydrogenase family)